MPELRQNPATKEWVIIATERAKRPEDLGNGFRAPLPPHNGDCPFCSGHEEKTPPEIFSYRSYGTKPNAPGWWVRVVPNKFAALLPGDNLERWKAEDFFISMDGVGSHEVLIECPEHDKTIATLDQKQVEEIFLAYRERYLALYRDPRSEMIIIFKNHGAGAGTSLQHSHSQIIAAPIVPMHIRHRMEEARRYFDDNGHCVFCMMLEKERKVKQRIVLESDNFAVLEPFASHSPFETWVMPKKHKPGFEGITAEECKELAFVMRQTLAKIYKSLHNPDYNYMFFSSPCRECGLEYYHWHVKIYPRVAAVAGFELGSGIFINTVIPEKAASFLRGIEVV
jgi:UDPglucose--hexose-1-phosphate uridylyltransferase